jgi:hypothetical protein
MMLNWLKRRARKDEAEEEAPPIEPAEAQGLGMSRAYLSLHTYLANRYSSVVVLTFAQMEDLLGSPLPAAARHDSAWWSDDHRNFGHTNSWRLAKRTAVANLVAQTVTFERY